MFGLQGKVIVITGAKGGLGTYVTNAFLNAGANVVGISRSIAPDDFPHHRFFAMPASLSGSESAHDVIESVAAKFERIDAVVHLMGGFEGGAPVADTDDGVLDRMLSLNFKPAFYVARAAIPQMRRQGQGRFLAVGSRAVLDPPSGVGAYTASKAALVSLIRTIALENKDAGITANAVLPATMDTPANRAAMPDADPCKWVCPSEVANMLMYLASDAARQVTGAVIPVYGQDL